MALTGNFVVEIAPQNANTSSNTQTYTYAIISGFRGDRYSITLDIFLCNNLEDELCSGVFQTATFTPDWDAEVNILKQGYEYIKTLPMFTPSEYAEPDFTLKTE